MKQIKDYIGAAAEAKELDFKTDPYHRKIQACELNNLRQQRAIANSNINYLEIMKHTKKLEDELNSHTMYNYILKQINIIDVVQGAMNIVLTRKTGRPNYFDGEKRDYYLASCPFHKNDTPKVEHAYVAFFPKKQTFYCSTCHKGGDVISFVARYYDITFADAVKTIERMIECNQIKLKPII